MCGWWEILILQQTWAFPSEIRMQQMGGGPQCYWQWDVMAWGTQKINGVVRQCLLGPEYNLITRSGCISGKNPF